MRGPRKSAFGGFKPTGGVRPKAQPKPDHPPVPRKVAFEQMLCEAIKGGVAVELRYHKPDGYADVQFRTFGPAAVYHSEQDKVCVSGEEIANPNDWHTRRSPRNFEIGRIVELRLTAQMYQPPATIDYTQAKYRNGIICRR